MSRFLRRVAAFAAIQLVILTYVLLAGKPPTDNYYAAMLDKLDRLESVEGPRLIIIGGSNAAFGIDSARVAADLDAEPVNLGLHAALGSEIYFRIVEDHIRPGDRVVILPEYELIRGVENETIQKDMCIVCPEVSDYLLPHQTGWNRVKSLLDVDAMQMLHTRTYHAMRKKRSDDGVYSRKSFNEFGDMIGHHQQPPSEKTDFGPLGWDESTAVAFVDRLNQFHKTCNAAGAEVYYSFAPLNRSRFESSREVLAQLEQLFAEKLTIPLLDSPADNVFDESQFYDTFYHLNQVAAQERSDRLNAALSRRVATEIGNGAELR